MRQIVLSLEDQAVLIRYPESLQKEIRSLLGEGVSRTKRRVASTITVLAAGDPPRFSLHADGRTQLSGLDKASCLHALVCEIGQSLLENLSAGVVIHAGAVSSGDKGIVIPGASGSGKSSLTAWLIDNGFDYLTDELVVFGPDVPHFTAFGRPLILREDTKAATVSLAAFASVPSFSAGSSTIVAPARTKRRARQTCRLLIFPQFASGEQLTIEALTPAQAGLELMACNVNARNLANHGVDTLISIARSVPAVRLRYGSFDVLKGALDGLIELILNSEWDAAVFSRIFRCFGVPADARAPEQRASDSNTTSSPPSTIPAPTPRKEPRKLTIGMATYDDYDGVYFSLQAIRMYHPEILGDTEFVVVDNNPRGRCAESLKQLEGSIANYRYVPYDHRGGTTVREIVFAESNAELVLCMDCHVFVVPGAVNKLIAYCDAHPDSKDLLQGPLIYDDLNSLSTHFEPKWRSGMYGCWATDERGKNQDAEPFEIPMQGLGVFACRRSAWPGFNRRFRGFGGEEGYLHEKFRQAGGRTLCLPFLRWMHRFSRPMGVPYVNTWEDRLRNYMIGFDEVGWDSRPVEEHFSELLGPAVTRPLIERIKAEIKQFGNDETRNGLLTARQ